MHLLHLDEPLLEINITPDRGYAFSTVACLANTIIPPGAAYTDPGCSALNEKAPITKGLPEGTKTDIEVIVDDNNPIHGVVGAIAITLCAVKGSIRPAIRRIGCVAA